MQYCFQKKGTGILLISVISGDKTDALLFSGEGNWCNTVVRRRKQMIYCFQEKETGALLFSGEGIWCFTVERAKSLCTRISRFFKALRQLKLC